MFWADKYVGKKWFFPESGAPEDKMCILLVLHILQEEKGFDIISDDKDFIYKSAPHWYDKAPKAFIKRASKYGKIITNYKELKEFDVPFFKIDGEVRHCGIMTNNFGMFLPQLSKQPALINRVHSRRWLNRFHIGIRIDG